MDSMVEKNLFGGIYRNCKVLITGHTGFKGSWLALWLRELGAEICGYSLQPPTIPNHFEALVLEYRNITGDIRDLYSLSNTIKDFQPDIIFHLAAQPLVRLSYKEPVDTFSTNIIGTANVLEAARKCLSVRAVVIITTDKCYENKEWLWGYRENDELGGHDPYSASKACAELVTACYRASFFSPDKNSPPDVKLIASARAGNVIGGGDWAADRLIPDLVRGASGKSITPIRYPTAVRPWQHVLESLSGYLLIGQNLLEGKHEFAEAWNFAPPFEEMLSVEEVVRMSRETWGDISVDYDNQDNILYETSVLRLDASKAMARLKWHTVWDTRISIERTVNWYKLFYQEKRISSMDDLAAYIHDATSKGLIWAQ